MKIFWHTLSGQPKEDASLPRKTEIVVSENFLEKEEPHHV
jgi:hypothetical protein